MSYLSLLKDMDKTLESKCFAWFYIYFKQKITSYRPKYVYLWVPTTSNICMSSQSTSAAWFNETVLIWSVQF